MKYLLITASLLVATASPALANKEANRQAHVEDHYKIVLEQKPYTVEVCKKFKCLYTDRQAQALVQEMY